MISLPFRCIQVLKPFSPSVISITRHRLSGCCKQCCHRYNDRKPTGCLSSKRHNRRRGRDQRIHLVCRPFFHGSEQSGVELRAQAFSLRVPTRMAVSSEAAWLYSGERYGRMPVKESGYLRSVWCIWHCSHDTIGSGRI